MIVNTVTASLSPVGAVARLQLRDASQRLVLDVEPVVTGAGDGRLAVAAVTLTPENWVAVRRDTEALDYDLQVTVPSVGTLTLVRGRLVITPDVTR